ncbi:hypothetical protein V7S43_018548 [Phytophthora oleae]|uniref:Uncharacterized protein n=1 Tax=Phytophthora oleae TaxID=2107226 RepID=A0ABD3ER82_9STRA
MLRRKRVANLFRPRLGGVDLRIFRDNFEALGGTSEKPKGKRSPSETSVATPTYVSSKRVRAKKRLEQFKDGVSLIEQIQQSANADITKLLVFFRQEAGRRADSEPERWREERTERESAEKQDWEKREEDRRVELAAAEARLNQLREDDRLHREEEAKKEVALKQERDQERADERRRHEERMELQRAEARQRHEQMMILLSKLGGST